MPYWVDRRDVAGGPPLPRRALSAAELREMAEAGRLKPTDRIAKSPDGPWIEADRVPALQDALERGAVHREAVPSGDAPIGGPAESGAGGPEDPPMEPSDAGDGERDDDDGFSILLLPAKAVEVLLRGLLHIAGGAFRALAGVASQAGHIGLILGVIAGTAILMVAAIRIDSLSMGLTSLAVPVAGAIAQFAAWKFITLCERMVRNSPTRTSSLVLFHFIGLLLMLGAVASIIVGSYLMVKYAEQAIALVSVGIAIVLTVQGLLYLDRPSTLNVVVDPSCTAGEDGLALIGTFLKASLVGARLIFGAVCLSGGVTAAIGATMFIVKDDQGWLALAVLGSWVVGYGALFPLTTYVVSVLYYIVPDVLLAVMRRGRSAR